MTDLEIGIAIMADTIVVGGEAFVWCGSEPDWTYTFVGQRDIASHLRAVRLKWADRTMKGDLGCLWDWSDYTYQHLDGFSKSLLRVSESRWYNPYDSSPRYWQFK